MTLVGPSACSFTFRMSPTPSCDGLRLATEAHPSGESTPFDNSRASPGPPQLSAWSLAVTDYLPRSASEIAFNNPEAAECLSTYAAAHQIESSGGKMGSSFIVKKASSPRQ